MKTLIKLCFGLYFGLAFLTSCENQTEGLIQPTANTKDAPPAYIIAAVRLQYPNATDLKVTVLEPDKLWKVEFMVNGQPFETYMDNDARWITSGRLALDDEADAIKKIITHWRGKYGKHEYTNAIFNRIRDTETKKVIYHYVRETSPSNNLRAADNKLYAVLYDGAGNALSEYTTPYEVPKALGTDGFDLMYDNIHFDMKNKQLVWIKYPPRDIPKYLPYPTTEPIYSTLKKFHWDDFSEISTVLQKADFPVKVGDYQLVYWSWPIYGSLVDERLTKIESIGTCNGVFGTQFSWTQPTRLKYWKYFEEELSMPGLMTKLDGTPLYILESVDKKFNHPLFDYKRIKNVSEIPATVTSEISRRGLPPIAQIVKADKFEYFNGSVLNYYLFYKGANNETIQFTIDVLNPNNFAYQTVIPTTEAELKPNLLNTIKAIYPNMKANKYFKYELFNKMSVLNEANGFEILFEDNGKVYSAKFVNIMGFDKPYIEQLY